MIEIRDLIDKVIRPTLAHLGDRYTGEHPERLLLGTAAAESRLGEDLVQDLNGGRHGPALGIWQMEPATANDIRDNYLRYQTQLRHRVEETRAPWPVKWSDPLTGNLFFACAMARVHYFRVRAAMPTTVEGYAHYWKTYYNTHLGAGTEEKFLEVWERLVQPQLEEL